MVPCCSRHGQGSRLHSRVEAAWNDQQAAARGFADTPLPSIATQPAGSQQRGAAAHWRKCTGHTARRLIMGANITGASNTVTVTVVGAELITTARPAPTSSAPVMATKLATASPGSMAPSAVQTRWGGRSAGWLGLAWLLRACRKAGTGAAAAWRWKRPGLHRVWRQHMGSSNSAYALRTCPARAQQQQGCPANRLVGRPTAAARWSPPPVGAAGRPGRDGCSF